MRLHHLRITAFGPFAGACEVDFEALSRSGLFLIQGPTGAGKTSVLDAICFALYAALPGARSGARTSLRSDHAEEGAVPEVELEFTASGRRLRVVRSPEFQRPKKRGTGTTKVQARVQLEELVDGQWLDRGTRHDEASLLIRDVVGMGLEQFIKVVLLPQGDFAAFLRANPEDRRAVLEKLFDTSRFTDIEDWLAARRRTVGAGLQGAREDLSRVLSQVQTALELVDDQPGEDPVPRPDWAQVPPDEVLPALSGVQEAVSLRATTAVAARDLAQRRHDAADAALHTARRTVELQRSAAQARAELAALEADRDTYEQAARQLDLAHRAAAVSGHLQSVDDCRAASAPAEAAAAGRREHVGSLVGEHPDQTRVTEVLDELGHFTPQVLQLTSLGQQVAEAAGRVTQHQAQALEATTLAATLTTRAEQLQAEADAQAERLTGARALAAGLPALRSRLTEAQRVGRLLAELADLKVELARVEPAVTDARRVALDARERWVSLRERRLEGMAAELARGLGAGEPCPVCGGCEHPAPATHHDPVTSDQVDDAEREASTAGATEAALQARAAGIRAGRDARVADLAEAAGTSGLAVPAPDDAAGRRTLAGELTGQVRALEVEVREASAAAAALAAAEAEADRLAQLLGTTRDEVGQAVSRREAAQALAATAHQQAGDLRARLRDVLAVHEASCPCHPLLALAPGARSGSGRGSIEGGETTDAEVPSVVADHHTGTQARLEALRQALRDAQTAQEAADKAEQRLLAAVAEHGLESAGAARAAALPQETVRQLSEALRAIDRRRDQAQAVLRQPDVLAAAGLETPDLDALAAARETAVNELGQTRDRHTLTERAHGQLRQIATAATAALAALGPAETEATLVQEIADCVGGTGANNGLRMRLSSYILAARLEEVAVLANERLDRMSDGRYALEYTDALAARGARSGLGLRVRDAWTGLPRDTATLSGGEAFMASLALALGLGDAVRAEAGGLDLQTLFVDEGFGTLDEESLEQVMAVLDGLREGGRAVGIVSHVAELRQRIPVQLRVTKTQHGSQMAASLGDENAA